MMSARAGRVLAVSVLTLTSAFGAPTAQAFSPPDVDDKWLPQPALPASPWPTVQREICTPMTVDAGPGRNQRTGLGDLSAVWQLSRGAGQRVAVVDTGISRHRRLPDVVPGGDYVSTGDGTQDCDAHGTLVAGIIAATVDSKTDGFSGVAPEATLISIRQSSAKFAPAGDRSRLGVGDVDTLAKAVRTAADLGASVINISSVACAPVASALDDRALGAALAYAVDVKNAVIVAAAGNTAGTGQCPPQRADATWQTITVAVSPAWYDDYVLTVGSVNAHGAPSPFTLAGPWVDVAAPGEAVSSLATEPVSGTSYAAPVVSGLAALIRARFPALTARQVMQRIETTAHHPPAGWDPLVGNGTIDPLAAVSTGTSPAADNPVPPPAPVPIATSPPIPPRDSRARDTALRGAAMCLAALTVTLATAAIRRRSRRARDHIPGD
ncbi:type VII secretion-associated serine protease mycosin [Mycobacterium colombiense]|uniref:type VII secretion-associated serine protease mycosin n=1 Tax=Mycobacterium colombiense TaxID=339268 RepID=UPI00096F5216|nr:type VII secretion-associated serine protease mycosin [Mycobacterium colombiense]OMC20461.1 type VII secretion-associated serine protease mycosin [Mycobacterium colombiense]OMC32887.1 type VII secretion-associated serine protease mycosin [Mycobacterium colombiense]